MTTIQTTPATVVQNVLAARPSIPKSRKPYEPAICARLAMTMMSAAMIPQPPIQPVRGPNARAAQVNVVPQSGSRLLSSAYATAMKYIGMNASSIIDGALTPTAMTTNPRVAARLYAGAVDAVPMTIDESSPTVPRFRPLSTAVPSIREAGPDR